MDKTIVAPGVTQAPWTAEAMRQFIESHPVVVFARGTREQPKCGFTARAIDCLDDAGISFTCVDVVADKSVIPAFSAIYGRSEFPVVVFKERLICDFSELKSFAASLVVAKELPASAMNG